MLNLVDPIFIVIGFFQSLAVIAKFRPDVIFSKGGYLSLPAVLAGRILFRKIIIHESDFKMGLANKLSSKMSDRVAVSFALDNYSKIDRRKLIYTGNPLKKISKTKKRIEGDTLFVWGGSQGSKKINKILGDSLKKLLKDFNVVHLTGIIDFKEISKARAALSGEEVDKYKVFSTVFNNEDFSRLMGEADIVISRAGASAIFETASLGKALILIPILGHQEMNANYLEKEKAALVIKNNNLSSGVLEEAIYKIKNSPELKRNLEENIARLSVPDATQKVASLILNLGK